MGKLTIYDITKESYPKVKGNDSVMWESTKFISDVMCEKCNMTEEEYWKILKEYYAILNGCNFNENFAEWQVRQMWYTDKEGKKHMGGHWTLEQTNEVYEKIKSKIPTEYNNFDWYVCLNMIYSDNICMYKTWWVDANDAILEQKVIEAAINWLSDVDAEKGKIWKYFNN